MDKRLEIPLTLRPGAAAGLAETPIYTLVWRALKAEHAKKAEEAARQEEQGKKEQAALVALAEEVFRLKRSRAAGAEAAAVRMSAALEGLGLEIIIPEGEVYSDGLMEVLDNLAQLPTPGICEPVVQEIVSPILVLHGDVIQVGKAVIAVPAPPASEQTQLIKSKKRHSHRATRKTN